MTGGRIRHILPLRTQGKIWGQAVRLCENTRKKAWRGLRQGRAPHENVAGCHARQDGHVGCSSRCQPVPQAPTCTANSGISPNSNADNDTAQCSPGQCTPTECHLCKPRRGKDQTAATSWCLRLAMLSRHQIAAWRDHGDQQTPDGCQRIWSGTMLSTLRAPRWCMHLGQGQRRQSRPSRQTK